MESLTNPEEKTEPKVKKEVAQGDRITLGKEESAKIDGWILQIEQKTNGMVQLSKSELLNYLVQKKNSELSTSEINQIRKERYDEVKFIHWALMKIKEAKRSGETITLEDLMRVQRGLTKPVKKPNEPDGLGRKRSKTANSINTTLEVKKPMGP